MSPARPAAGKRRLQLLSFNIQAGAYTGSYREYLTRGWQSVLPHKGKLRNLAAIAELARAFDIVALQEADSISVRSGFRHQVEYLAESAAFPYWSHQRNRGLGVAEPGNGVLTRIEPSSVLDHRLPGAIPGRGALEVRFGEAESDFRLLIVHLALTASGQRKQAQYLAEVVAESRHIAVLGDFNCAPDSEALRPLYVGKHLRQPEALPSFPSWKPVRAIDQVLLSRTIKCKRYQVLPIAVSDHLPVAVEIELPRACSIHGAHD